MAETAHLQKTRLSKNEHTVRSQRSRVTNAEQAGLMLLPGIDGRNPWVRRVKDLIEVHTSDLGGYEEITAAERSLLRRVAVLTAEAERLEAIFALADKPDILHIDLYTRLASQVHRILCSLGLQRRTKVVGPTLADYMAERQQIDAVRIGADEQLDDDGADGKP